MPRKRKVGFTPSPAPAPVPPDSEPPAEPEGLREEDLRVWRILPSTKRPGDSTPTRDEWLAMDAAERARRHAWDSYIQETRRYRRAVEMADRRGGIARGVRCDVLRY